MEKIERIKEEMYRDIERYRKKLRDREIKIGKRWNKERRGESKMEDRDLTKAKKKQARKTSLDDLSFFFFAPLTCPFYYSTPRFPCHFSFVVSPLISHFTPILTVSLTETISYFFLCSLPFLVTSIHFFHFSLFL